MARHQRIILNSKVIGLEILLAAQIGLNEAIVLGHLYWRITTYEEDKCEDKRHGDAYWFQGKYQDMVDTHFPFLSIKTLQRTLESLEGKELIIVRHAPQGVKTGNWYTINRDAITVLNEQTGARKRKGVTGQNDQSETGPSLDNLTSEVTRQNDQSESPVTGQIDQCSLDNLTSESFHYRALKLHKDSTATDRDAAAAAADSCTSCIDTKALVLQIVELGIDYDMANDLVTAETADLDNIHHQLAAWPFHNKSGLKNPVGYLIASIRKKRALPPAYLEHLATEAEKQRQREQVQRNRADGARLTEALQRQEQDMETKLCAYEGTLDDLERADLQMQARSKLSSFWRAKWDKCCAAGERPLLALEVEWRKAWREVLLSKLNGGN